MLLVFQQVFRFLLFRIATEELSNHQKWDIHPISVIKMPSSASILEGPPELRDTIKDDFSYNVLPTYGVCQLLSLARAGHGDYTWGFRIYRTTYRAGSDTDFARAIDILNEWIRDECFSYSKDDRLKRNTPRPPLSRKANKQLAQRLRHDIVEDQQLLEGATPDKILKLTQDWVHHGQKARTGDSPHYCFFLVIDNEVIEQLLQLQASELSSGRSLAAAYLIKVFDTRHDSPTELSHWDHSGSEADEDYVNEYENPNDPMYGY